MLREFARDHAVYVLSELHPVSDHYLVFDTLLGDGKGRMSLILPRVFFFSFHLTEKNFLVYFSDMLQRYWAVHRDLS